jgi:hypothetical protein
MKEIEIKCKGADYLSLDQLLEFQGRLKKISSSNKEKLRQSILKYGFSAPFFVWKNQGKYRLLDGHQRSVVLKKMRSEGFKIPDLPVVYVQAKSKKEAKEKLLHITSQYGKFSKEGFFDFINDLDFKELDETMRLADKEFDFKLEDDDLDDEPEVEFTEELLEEHNYLVLYFDNKVDWLQVQSILDLKTVKSLDSKPGFIRKGVGRVINGAEALEKLRGDSDESVG